MREKERRYKLKALSNKIVPVDRVAPSSKPLIACQLRRDTAVASRAVWKVPELFVATIAKDCILKYVVRRGVLIEQVAKCVAAECVMALDDGEDV